MVEALLKQIVSLLSQLVRRSGGLNGTDGSSPIKRKPDSARLDGVNVTKETSINGCIDFTIQNAGAAKLWYGFSKEQQDIELNPGENATWPLYRPCEVWDGSLYVKFVTNSVAQITKTI